MKRRIVTTLGAALLLALAACGEPTKDEIIAKARGVETRADLEKKVGRPTDIQKLGPIEMWTYRTKTGDVVFVITGERVALQAAE
jgi:hypothetical protein